MVKLAACVCGTIAVAPPSAIKAAKMVFFMTSILVLDVLATLIKPLWFPRRNARCGLSRRVLRHTLMTLFTEREDRVARPKTRLVRALGRVRGGGLVGQHFNLLVVAG